MNNFKLPDLGEGLQDAEIIEWRVKAGDQVKADQVILVVETAKAIVELPSPVSGVIGKICVNEGETAQVGQILVEYVSEKVESVSVVGELAHVVDQDEPELEAFVIGAAESNTQTGFSGQIPSNKRSSNQRTYQVSPDVLAFANALGISHVLDELPPEKISKATLADYYEKVKGSDASLAGLNNQIPLTGTKKLMAQAMMKSHQHVPAVTLFDDACIDHWESNDVTVRIVMAIIEACKAVPILNAWFDEEAYAIQTFSDVNIGIAVNSNEGLFVPVLREAQSLSSTMLRKIIDKMIRDVESRKIKPQKLMGATISLSNFGTLRGRYATPIIVPPQVAIVGVGRIRKEPVVKDGQVCVGAVLPISLSFDHRAATGAEAASFMDALINNLEAES